MSRKTSKDYSKEYSALFQKKEALEAHIKTRTIEMCKENPDVLVGEISTAIEFVDHIEVGSAVEYADHFEEGADEPIEMYLNIMSKIEEHNAQQAGHVQTTMFPKS